MRLAIIFWLFLSLEFCQKACEEVTCQHIKNCQKTYVFEVKVDKHDLLYDAMFYIGVYPKLAYF